MQRRSATMIVLTLTFLAVFFAFDGVDLLGQQKQPDDPKDTKKKGILPQGWKKLNLSAKQKSDIYGIQADYKVKIKDLETKIKDLRDKEHSELVKILTATQREQLAKDLGLSVTPPEKKPDDTKKPDDKK